MTIAQAIWFVFLGGMVYMGLCIMVGALWGLVMAAGKNKRRQAGDEHFRRHLDRCSKTVDSWPHWKQNVLGPHKKPEETK